MNPEAIEPVAQDTRALEYRLAVPSDTDGIAQLYHDVYSGHYTLAECTDPALVRSILTNNKHIWAIALEGGTVIGASVARPEPVNDIYELCRTAVRPGYSGHGVAGKLYGTTIMAAIERRDCEVFFGYARSERMRRATDRTGFRTNYVGTDGGEHLVFDKREEHLIGVAPNPRRSLTRVLPPKPLVLPGSAVDKSVAEFGGTVVEGSYPDRFAPGGTVEHVHESQYGRVCFAFSELSLTASISDVEGARPADIRRLIWQLFDGAIPCAIEHAGLYVLADKLDLVAELCRAEAGTDRRFKVNGYLPAWYEQDGRRYDCIMLSARTDHRATERNGLDEQIAAIEASFPGDLR